MTCFVPKDPALLRPSTFHLPQYTSTRLWLKQPFKEPLKLIDLRLGFKFESIYVVAGEKAREDEAVSAAWVYMRVSGGLHRLVSPPFLPDSGEGLPMIPTIGWNSFLPTWSVKSWPDLRNFVPACERKGVIAYR